ncbi:MAG TPA: hypothetical protein VF177_11680, partial [Anaerolineae bacterium]
SESPMAKRLTELYQPGDQVEITFGHNEWQPGRVVRHDHPGVWVQTMDGRIWFVTNGRHIRRMKDEG